MPLPPLDERASTTLNLRLGLWASCGTSKLPCHDLLCLLGGFLELHADGVFSIAGSTEQLLLSDGDTI